MRRWAVPAAVYALAAVALTWPLAISLTSHLGAPVGPGDPYLNLWALGWGMHAWVTDPFGALTGRAFDANIFHPAPGTLTYSDHQLVQALVVAPLYAVTGDAVLGYNVVLLLSIALSGLAMHALVQGVSGSPWGAYAAGLAWACWPYRTAHLLHIQLQALFLLPLALLALHRVAAAGRRRDAVALGVAAGLQAVVSVYYGVMTAVTLIVAGTVLAVTTGQWRSRRLIGGLALAGVVGLLVVAPVLPPYLRSGAGEGFGRNLYEAANHAAGVASYTQVPPSNLLYGRTGLLSPRPPAAGSRDRSGVEHQMFPGLVLLVLTAAGAWRGWRDGARPAVAASAALIATGIVLSAGPEGVRFVYAALYDAVFGFQAIRAPARFAVVAVAGACVLAGFALRGLPDSRRGRLAGIVVIGVLAAEYVNAPLALVEAPPRTTPVGQWLRQAPEPGAVVHLPLDMDVGNTPAMVQSLEHWRPLVNGYSGQRPAFFTAVVESLAGLPSPDAYATLKELDVRFVVSNDPLPGAGEAASPLVERAALDGGHIYEVRWTPEAEAALLADAPAPPAPPPDVPFAVGETATYDVLWEGGPLDVPAGTATLRVIDVQGEPGGRRPDARWAFEVTARTADWVETFFEANDRFLTVAGPDLAPLVHTRWLREGRRVVDRTYVFDAAARLVRMGVDLDEASAADALSLPLAPGARDAVTALYYARAMALGPGDVLVLPLNEGGRGSTLHLSAGDVERAGADGRQTPALRVDARLTRRIERRQPLTMRVWLSDDDRRVPVALVVEAGFGRVRANLVDYRR
ncbi:MAG: DUF3108 domain-containing protein [Acidobacteriota bacterium]